VSSICMHYKHTRFSLDVFMGDSFIHSINFHSFIVSVIVSDHFYSLTITVGTACI